MDAVLAVEREVDKVLSKFGDIRRGFSDGIQDLIDNLENMKNDLLENNTNGGVSKPQLAQIKELVGKSKKDTQKLAVKHRELHSTVSKVGKSIDKNFEADFGAIFKEDICSRPGHTFFINLSICQHFYRNDMNDIAQELLKESDILLSKCVKKPFDDINAIKRSLENKDITPALEWAQENRKELETQVYPPYPLIQRFSTASHLPMKIPLQARRNKFSGGIMKPRPKTKKIKRMELAKKILQQFYRSSSLEFKLHQLAFMTIIEKGVEHQTEAVAYARANFGQFADKYEKEIQTMMGMLLFVPQGINKSPYSDIVGDNLWDEAKELFSRDACVLHGISVDSPLSVSINAGCDALPALLSIKDVMKQRKVDGIWKGNDELPIEINLDKDHRYHSMFACPILRQQTTASNPPMKLVCGHIISKDALQKLPINAAKQLKCPYCPVSQSPSDAKVIYF